MHDRIASPGRWVDRLPELEGQGRDLRIDACRGVALWFIFLDHVPNNIGAWLTLRNYGFSDAAEVFTFLSGVTCALAYGKAWSSEGWTGVIVRTLRRSWAIYVAFLLLTLACTLMAYLAGGGQFADDSNTRILLEQPGATLTHATMLQYRPVNTDILPLFVLLHLLFAPLLWLLLRMPNVALGASFALYVLVQVFGWDLPAWPSGYGYFNPLAWQLLVVLGAWWMIEGKRVLPWVASRTALVVAALYLLISLASALSLVQAPRRSSDSASRKSDRRLDLAMVYTVSAVVATKTTANSTRRCDSGASASASRFMPRKPVVTVPTRPKIVTTVSRTTVLAWRRRLSASR